jgi:hypothetical protein
MSKSSLCFAAGCAASLAFLNTLFVSPQPAWADNAEDRFVDTIEQTVGSEIGGSPAVWLRLGRSACGDLGRQMNNSGHSFDEAQRRLVNVMVGRDNWDHLNATAFVLHAAFELCPYLLPPDAFEGFW